MSGEAQFWAWFRDNGINKYIPKFGLIERVENGVLDGMADTSYAIRGVDGWIELKSTDLPARPTTAVLGRGGLRKEQVNWHLRRAQVLSKTWVFIRAKPHHWLIHGFKAEHINAATAEELTEMSAVHVEGPWKEADWVRMFNWLSGKFEGRND